MTVGDPIRDGWGIYRRFWQHLLTASLVTYVVVSAISVLLVAALGAVGGLLSVIVELMPPGTIVCGCGYLPQIST